MNSIAPSIAETSAPPTPPPTFKILLIGDSGTGKSSLLLRFTDDTFLADEMSSTIGVDFKVKYISIPGAEGPQKIKLTIWDTAGQERFRTLTSSYYRGAQGVIFVYDVTSLDSFTHLSDVWLPEMETYASSDDVVKMVVGNKLDMESSLRQVSRQEGQRFAMERGALFIECSAKTRVGVQQAFEELCLKIAETPSLWKKQLHAVPAHLNMNSTANNEDPSCSC